MNSVNEEQFNNACKKMNNVVTSMNTVTGITGSMSVPAEFSMASTIVDVKNKLEGEVKSKVEEYISVFESLNASVAALIDAENNALGAIDGLSPDFVTDDSGNVIGIEAEDGSVISFDEFKKTVTDAGTYYQWPGSENTNLTTACDIFVPGSDITGTTVYFTGLGGLSGDPNIRNLRDGKVDTSSIIIIPTQCYNYNDDNSALGGITAAQAKTMASDVKDIASAFGADPNNIAVYGFSAGGSIVGSLINKNDPGTFKTAIFASTKDGINGVNDPNVKVISILGSSEKSNAEAVRERVDEFQQNHVNDVELYVLPSTDNITSVTHGYVTQASIETDMFNGQNIFDYAASSGAATV